MGVSRRREQCRAMGPKRRARGAHVAAAASCSIVRTTAPSGMKQEFRVDEISSPHVLRFSLVRSSWFRTAQLTFTLMPVEDGVCITHQISVAFRFPWTILVPILALINKRALAADLDSLRRAIDEGHDLTARKGS